MDLLTELKQQFDATKHLDQLRLECHEFIKAQLRIRQTSLAETGRLLGIKTGTMSAISQGIGKSKRVQRKLAEILDIPPSTLWPERFEKQNEEKTNDLEK